MSPPITPNPVSANAAAGFSARGDGGRRLEDRSHAAVAADCFFTRVGLNRLVALTTIDNKSSLRALEKVGMRHRGETQHEDGHTTYELFELARPARQP